MTFTQSITSVFSNYATFGGRATRSEYWWFALFQYIVYFVISMSFGLASVDYSHLSTAQTIGSSLTGFYSLATLLPSLAVAVRRMHDIGKGGGWIFVSLIPLVGWIWFIILAATPSQPGANRFGNAPQS